MKLTRYTEDGLEHTYSAPQKRLAQADIRIDDDGLFVPPAERPPKPAKRQHIRTARNYLARLKEKQGLAWFEACNPQTGDRYIVTDYGMVAVYDKDGYHTGAIRRAEFDALGLSSSVA